MKIQNRIILLLLIAATGVCCFSWFIYNANRQANEYRRMANDKYEVINSLQALLAKISDVESGTRAFVITGQATFEEDVKKQSQEALLQMELLQRQISDNTAQKENSVLLKQLVN